MSSIGSADVVYQPGNRPRCPRCDRELEPAGSFSDGEPVLRGFWPCPRHPHAKVRYPLDERGAKER